MSTRYSSRSPNTVAAPAGARNAKSIVVALPGAMGPAPVRANGETPVPERAPRSVSSAGSLASDGLALVLGTMRTLDVAEAGWSFSDLRLSRRERRAGRREHD